MKRRFHWLSTGWFMGLALGGNTSFADEALMFTKEDVIAFSPRARDDLVTVLVDNQKLLREKGITKGIRLMHFFAQIATETGGLRRLDEDMHYSEKGLLNTFSRNRISTEKAAEIAGKPRETANWVYGDILGNKGRDTNDGWDYRGSGFIQLTGRKNFQERSGEVHLPLENEPSLVRKPFEGLIVATAYWASRNINDAAAMNDIRKVRILVNGKRAHGLSSAEIWFGRATKVFAKDDHSEKESATLLSTMSENESAAVSRALTELGFLNSSTAKESAAEQEDKLSNALRSYQKSRGLPETGQFNEDTLYSITDPKEWRGDPTENGGPTEDIEVEDPLAEGDPEATVTHELVSGTMPTNSTANKAPIESASSVERGTGVLNTNTNISPQELALLANAETMFAPFEVAEGRRSTDNTFIPYSILGEDDRTVIQDTTEFPARAIVQIMFFQKGGGSYLCSGALVSPDTVLTAGHCLHAGTVSGEWHEKFVIYPGRNSGSQPFGNCIAIKLYTLNGWVKSGSALAARQYDLGALKLDCDVGRRTGWFAIRAVNSDEINLPTTVQGYPGDKAPFGRQWTSSDKIRVVQDLNVFYDNDTAGGMSGSPVYTKSEDTVFAIHTSGLHNGEPWKTHNGATRITRQRVQTIENWIKD